MDPEDDLENFLQGLLQSIKRMLIKEKEAFLRIENTRKRKSLESSSQSEEQEPETFDDFLIVATSLLAVFYDLSAALSQFLPQDHQFKDPDRKIAWEKIVAHFFSKQLYDDRFRAALVTLGEYCDIFEGSYEDRFSWAVLEPVVSQLNQFDDLDVKAVFSKGKKLLQKNSTAGSQTQVFLENLFGTPEVKSKPPPLQIVVPNVLPTSSMGSEPLSTTPVFSDIRHSSPPVADRKPGIFAFLEEQQNPKNSPKKPLSVTKKQKPEPVDPSIEELVTEERLEARKMRFQDSAETPIIIKLSKSQPIPTKPSSPISRSSSPSSDEEMEVFIYDIVPPAEKTESFPEQPSVTPEKMEARARRFGATSQPVKPQPSGDALVAPDRMKARAKKFHTDSFSSENDKHFNEKPPYNKAVKHLDNKLLVAPERMEARARRFHSPAENSLDVPLGQTKSAANGHSSHKKRRYEAHDDS